MSKRLFVLLISLILLLAIAGSAKATAWTDAAPANSLWSTPGNWTDSELPHSGTNANIRSMGGVYPTLASGAQAAYALYIEGSDSADIPILTMTGGTLQLGQNASDESFNIGHGDAVYGILDMYDGTINITGISFVGNRGFGTLNMYGGAINMGYYKLGNNTSSPDHDAFMNLHGGILNATGIELRLDSLTDVYDGTLRILGDWESAMITARTNGNLIAFGGIGELYIDFDGTYTVVTAADTTKAYDPVPENGAIGVDLDATLSWTPASGATMRDIYFGTNPAALPVVEEDWTPTTYDPGPLDPNITYHWRIDEIVGSSTSTGYLWSFTTEAGYALDPSPENGADYVPTDTLLSWQGSDLAVSHKVYMGALPGEMELKAINAVDANSYDPNGLFMCQTYYWRIDEVLDGGGTNTGSVWSFTTEGLAKDPDPFDGANLFETDVTFSWTPGIQSGSQDVYFGTDFNDVNNASRPVGDVSNNGVVNYDDTAVLAEQWLQYPSGGGVSGDLNFDKIVNLTDLAIMANCWGDSADAEFKVNQPIGSNSYNPGTLSPGTTYYWRVDSVQGSDRCKGDVWEFSSGLMGLAAFPGAEGWGSDTVGGRGGQVIKVTNLNSSGPGSLAAACATAGPRIVVFEVSGVIPGTLRITQPYITIAGQTAPGGGITIEGMVQSFDYHVHNMVIRHIRVRPQPSIGSSGDGFQLGGTVAYNIILDHCSVSWGNDEIIDLYWGHDMTIQWCSIEESDDTGHPKGVHNFGMISAAENSGAVSAHHNLWAHHYRRVPCMAPYRENAADDFRNNLIYDCYGGLTHDGHDPGIQSPLNDFYNYTKRGPSCMDKIYPFATIGGINYYIEGNYFEDWGLQGHPAYWTWGGSTPSWVQFNNNGNVLTSPANVPPITTHPITDAASATALYDLILAKAGAWPKDRVTLRTIDEVINQTGSYGRDAPADPNDAWFMDGLTPTAPPVDTDNDGMPDTWETAHSLNPSNPADAVAIVPAGASPDDRHMDYTYIEYYINELADNFMP